ncbi:MAG TPA: YncE family protein [Bryobacteraceae bacterium]|jgi:DNA-binding beta-propeller fold protein YncE|nr:YncE family protein [Bryobacteraceae bacterium]
MSSPSQADETSSGFLLVANKGDHTLGIVNPVAGKQLAAIPEGGVTGHEVAATPDGRRAFVPIYGNSGVGQPGTNGQNIAVFDLTTRERTGNIEFNHPVRPHCAVFGPKNGLLYVTTELDKAIAVIDPKDLKIIGSVPTDQPESHMLAISHDGTRGYTANVGPGTVSVLDLEARKVLAVIPISKNTQRISISADDSMVFTADQEKPRIAVIDTATNKVKTWIPLPAIGFGTTATLDGRWLLATLPKSNQVAVINLKTLKVDHLVDVPSAPQEILAAPGGQFVYVSCNVKHQVAVVRTSDWSVEKLIDCGKDSDGLAWAAAR